jgi:hypothetical protein
VEKANKIEKHILAMTTDAQTKENMDQKIVNYLKDLEAKKKLLEQKYEHQMKHEELKAAEEIEGSLKGPLGAVRRLL